MSAIPLPQLLAPGTTVFVAGGTSGINLGIAECFARQGCRVAVLSRKQNKVEAAQERLQEAGAADTLGFAADVRKFDAVEQAFVQTAEAWGPLAVLVSGAAGNFPMHAKDLSNRGFSAVMEIGVLGTWHVMKAAYPHLQRPGASIVNISAPQAFQAMAMQVHVCSSKAGVDMITRCLAQEWGREGIRVNSVVPGPIEGTEGMARLAPTQGIQDMVVKTVPLGRIGQTEDVGKVALFLASDLGAYVSGAVIPVDGGWTLGGTHSTMAKTVELMEAMKSK